jgi:hypothetical protein
MFFPVLVEMRQDDKNTKPKYVQIEFDSIEKIGELAYFDDFPKYLCTKIT